LIKTDFELRIIDGSKETPLREPSHVYVRGGNTKNKRRSPPFLVSQKFLDVFLPYTNNYFISFKKVVKHLY